jgi:hypothetical protein
VTGFGKQRWNHIAHLRKMAGDGVAAFGAGFFGLPNSAKHLAIDGWWDEGSHPMFGNIYYATISKKQANLAFRSDPSTCHRAMPGGKLFGIFGHRWKMEKRPYQESIARRHRF